MPDWLSEIDVNKVAGFVLHAKNKPVTTTTKKECTYLFAIVVIGLVVFTTLL
jgi:hypothetical protein